MQEACPRPEVGSFNWYDADDDDLLIFFRYFILYIIQSLVMTDMAKVVDTNMTLVISLIKNLLALQLHFVAGTARGY